MFCVSSSLRRCFSESHRAIAASYCSTSVTASFPARDNAIIADMRHIFNAKIMEIRAKSVSRQCRSVEPTAQCAAPIVYSRSAVPTADCLQPSENHALFWFDELNRFHTRYHMRIGTEKSLCLIREWFFGSYRKTDAGTARHCRPLPDRG